MSNLKLNYAAYNLAFFECLPRGWSLFEDLVKLIRELAPANLFWLECMVSENSDNHGVLKRVRGAAREFGDRCVTGFA